MQELKVGDSVKMAGVEIGRVEKIALTDNKVKVTMKLHPDAVVKTDSKAIIKFTGLMGQNFVAIDFGSPDAPRGRRRHGARNRGTARPQRRHGQARRGRRRHRNVGKSFTGDNINNLLGPLADFVKQNSGHISGAHFQH